MIYCLCGSKRNGDGPDGKKYYRCISRHKYYDRKTRCAVGGLNVILLDTLVWDKTEKLLTSPELIQEFATDYMAKTQESAGTANSKLKNLNSQLLALSEEEARYAEAYGKGVMPLELFEKKINDLTPAKSSIKQEIDKLSQNRGKIGKINVEELAKKAVQKVSDFGFEQKKFVVERVIDKITATPKEISVWGTIPVPAFAGVTPGKVKYEPKHRGSGFESIPYFYTFEMPKPDDGKRGYSNRYITDLQITTVRSR